MKTEHFSCFYQVICCFLLVAYLSILNASPLQIVTKSITGNCIVRNRWVAAQSIFYHLYNQVSYMSLDEISPLTFSIGNTMKRISVIVSSIIIFHTPVQPVNALGAAIAIFGTFLYSQVFSCHHFSDFDLTIIVYCSLWPYYLPLKRKMLCIFETSKTSMVLRIIG